MIIKFTYPEKFFGVLCSLFLWVIFRPPDSSFFDLILFLLGIYLQYSEYSFRLSIFPAKVYKSQNTLRHFFKGSTLDHQLPPIPPNQHIYPAPHTPKRYIMFQVVPVKEIRLQNQEISFEKYRYFKKKQYKIVGVFHRRCF